MKPIIINSELFVNEQQSDGSSRWTLASRLGDMIYRAEELFGPRDSSYTILGVEFFGDIPHIWYPGNRQHIVIRLSLEAATDLSQACYQMAHEAIHLLAPTASNDANNLEEGVACYFADLYIKEVLRNPYPPPSLPSYRTAFQLVKPLLDADRYCVRRLRDQQPSFPKVSREQISTAFPNLTSENVNFLISKFDRSSG